MLKRSNIVAAEEDLQAFYRELDAQSLAALWTQGGGGGPEPKSKAVPFVWHWQDLRPQAIRAAELVGTEQAERRVLIMANPGLPFRAATNTLTANIQVVMPGEIARAHRHTAAALRLIIESEGGYTVVNGHRIPMLPGDLVLTPNWTWHDHANDTNAPMIWLDGLDSPLIRMLECGFREEYEAEAQSVGVGADPSFAKYGAGGLRPAWEQAPTAQYSPLWHYPYTQTQRSPGAVGSRGLVQPLRRGDHGVHQSCDRRTGHAHDRVLCAATCARASTPRRTATRPVRRSTSSKDQATPSWMASGSTGRTRTCSACRAGPSTSTSTPANSQPSCSATPTCRSCGRWTSIARRHTPRAGNSAQGMRRTAVSLSVGETSVTREELLRRATALLPVLKERAARTEQLRQIPPETVQDLVSSGLIRLGNPQRYGGLGIEYDAAFDVAWELGRACGSTAWCYCPLDGAQLVGRPLPRAGPGGILRWWAGCPGVQRPQSDPRHGRTRGWRLSCLRPLELFQRL